MASSVGCSRASWTCSARATVPMATNVSAMTFLMSSASVALIVILLPGSWPPDRVTARILGQDAHDLLICGQRPGQGQTAAHSTVLSTPVRRGCSCGLQQESEAAADVPAHLS